MSASHHAKNGTATGRTAVLPDIGAIPDELKRLDQWVCWRWASRHGKRTKIPINPRNGRMGDVSDRSTWGMFEEAFAFFKQRRLAGIGFVFTANDPFVGVDLDDCLDSITSVLESWAAEIIDAFSTYAERSPSGTGIKLIGRGKLPTDKTGTRRPFQSGAVEMYQFGRFFTVTGNVWRNAPSMVNDCGPQLNDLWARIQPKPRGSSCNANRRVSAGVPSPDDDDVVRRAQAAKNGAKFSQLWDGDIDGFASASEADLSLCSILAFWCGPAAASIDRLFRQSGLIREKWEREDYRTETISKAIEGCGKFYDWSKSRRRSERGSRSPVQAHPSCNGSEEVAGNSEAESLVSVLPKIDAGCKDLSVITPQAWEAIQRNNKPEQLFRYGGVPARIERGDRGEPVIRILDQDRMRHHLARFAIWTMSVKSGETEVEKVVAPPREVVRDLLATPDMPLPKLSRITEAPTFAPDGALETVPGYHQAAKVFYAPAVGFLVPAVSAIPTDAEVADARALVCEELLGDFPFVGESEIAHAVALYLLPFVRDLIEGPTPLHLIEKSTPGTGATLLADALTYPAIGRPLAAMTEGRDEDEWRKRIFAKLRGGAPYGGSTRAPCRPRSQRRFLTTAFWVSARTRLSPCSAAG